MLIWHCILVLIQESFRLVLYVVSVVCNDKSTVAKSRLFEEILEGRVGKVLIQFLAKTLVCSCWKARFLLQSGSAQDVTSDWCNFPEIYLPHPAEIEHRACFQ